MRIRVTYIEPQGMDGYEHLTWRNHTIKVEMPPGQGIEEFKEGLLSRGFKFRYDPRDETTEVHIMPASILRIKELIG